MKDACNKWNKWVVHCRCCAGACCERYDDEKVGEEHDCVRMRQGCVVITCRYGKKRIARLGNDYNDGENGRLDRIIYTYSRPYQASAIL